MARILLALLLFQFSQVVSAGRIIVNFQPIHQLQSGEIPDGTKLAKGTIQYTGSEPVSFVIVDNEYSKSNNEINLISMARPEERIIARIEGAGWIKNREQGFIHFNKSQGADFYLVTSGKQKINADLWAVKFSVGIYQQENS